MSLPVIRTCQRGRASIQLRQHSVTRFARTSSFRPQSRKVMAYHLVTESHVSPKTTRAFNTFSRSLSPYLPTVHPSLTSVHWQMPRCSQSREKRPQLQNICSLRRPQNSSACQWRSRKSGISFTNMSVQGPAGFDDSLEKQKKEAQRKETRRR